MRRLFRSAKKGALAGWVLGGAVGVLTIISGAGPKDGLALRLFLAFMVAGFYGAVPGAVVGGLVGLVKGRSGSGAPSLPPAPLGVPFPVAPPTPAPDRGNWIGVIGEALETRATVLSVKPYSDLWATRALRYLHYLRTPDGQVLRWLANEDRGLSAGKEVILRGTIKDHTWDSAGQAVTEVWYCQTRPAPRPRFAPPVTRDEAAPQPRPTPTSKPESKPPSERPKVEVDRAAVIRGANEMRSKAAQEKEPRKPQLLAPVKPAPNPVTRSGVDLSDPQRLNRVLDELDALPGLEHVAEQVRGMARRIMLDQQRREAGLKVAEQGLSCLFIGPPGTGKTSVARIWGRVLVATGLLPSGHVVEVDRSDLVGQTIGSTGPKTLAKVDEAMGGVLFLDEAYSLAPKGATGQDFGGEAIAALLKAMEDKRGKFAVIAAGYEREMAAFLESNSGLRSRFSHTVDFPNYSGEALVSIAERMAAAGDYRWADNALLLLGQAFARLSSAPPQGWANARSVRGVLDGAISAQADRLAESGDVSREALTTLTEADARATLTRLHPQAV